MASIPPVIYAAGVAPSWEKWGHSPWVAQDRPLLPPTAGCILSTDQTPLFLS